MAPTPYQTPPVSPNLDGWSRASKSATCDTATPLRTPATSTATICQPYQSPSARVGSSLAVVFVVAVLVVAVAAGSAARLSALTAMVLANASATDAARRAARFRSG